MPLRTYLQACSGELHQRISFHLRRAEGVFWPQRLAGILRTRHGEIRTPSRCRALSVRGNLGAHHPRPPSPGRFALTKLALHGRLHRRPTVLFLNASQLYALEPRVSEHPTNPSTHTRAKEQLPPCLYTTPGALKRCGSRMTPGMLPPPADTGSK